MRNFEAVIVTKEEALEEKSKDVPKVGVKRAPTLKNIIPGGKYYIESGRNVNISVIDIPVG